MKQETIKPVPAIVEMLTFWFGSKKTNWQGLQKAFGLSDKQTNKLKRENQAYRDIQMK